MVGALVAVGAFTLGLIVGAINGYDSGWGWGWLGHAEGDLDPWEQYRRVRAERHEARARRLRTEGELP